MLQIEDVLAKCGDNNRFQLLMMVLFCFINLLSSLHYYSQTIISFVPKYSCVDGFTDSQSTHIQPIVISTCLSNISLTSSNGTCSRYNYEYFMDYKSLTSELNWICDDAWQLAVGQSTFFMGSVIGTLIFGYFADIVGRLPVLIAANMTAMVGNLSTIFGTTLTSFSLCRFISGLATDCNFAMMYILVLEYLRPSMRTMGLSICIGVFYCLGSMSAPWIAVLMGSWQGYLLATALPFILVPFFYFLVPESVQWLISRQKYNKAIKCFKYIASVNRREVDDSVYDEFIKQYQVQQTNIKNTHNIFDLFKTPRLRRNTLILFFKSIVITLGYDAVSRNVEGLGIPPFYMFTLSAMTILPACLLLVALQDKVGRKAMASISLLVSGIFISTTGFLIYRRIENNNLDVVTVVTLSVIGRFGVTVAYNSSAQYATELIPTSLRGQGVAVVHVIGYAFTSLSSYIIYTRRFFQPMPEIILGGISLLGAVLCLFLPETLNRNLPMTPEEAENFGRHEPWYYFSFLEGKRKPARDSSLSSQGHTNEGFS